MILFIVRENFKITCVCVVFMKKDNIIKVILVDIIFMGIIEGIMTAVELFDFSDDSDMYD